MSRGLGHLDERRIVAIGDVGLRAPAVVDDVEPEGADARRDRLADPPEPEDAHGRPRSEGLSGKAPFAPLPGAQVSLGLRQLAHRHDHEAIAVSATSSSSTPGVLVTMTPCSRRPFGVDVVVADAEAGDDLELGNRRI